MRTRMKVVCWSATILVLIASAGCVVISEWGERRNEVTRGYYWINADGEGVLCIEHISASTNNTLNIRNVYVTGFPFLQAYRIEGRKIFNCRWVNRLDESVVARDDFDIVSSKWLDMYKACEQLPNKLKQNDSPHNPLGNSPVVAITTMDWGPWGSPSPEAAWSYWTTWLWTGRPEEVPEAIEAFRQAIEQVLSVPKYAKKYRSYLRAVPLLTEEALEAEKDTPLIDLKKMSYHVQYATSHPYVLFPISGTPFCFSVKRYTPGDKFKARYEWDGKAYYFLIETFKGG